MAAVALGIAGCGGGSAARIPANDQATYDQLSSDAVLIVPRTRSFPGACFDVTRPVNPHSERAYLFAQQLARQYPNRLFVNPSDNLDTTPMSAVYAGMVSALTRCVESEATATTGWRALLHRLQAGSSHF